MKWQDGKDEKWGENGKEKMRQGKNQGEMSWGNIKGVWDKKRWLTQRSHKEEYAEYRETEG